MTLWHWNQNPSTKTDKKCILLTASLKIINRKKKAFAIPKKTSGTRKNVKTI